jgi:Mrp family chromosome partitioning ATPase
MVANLAAAAAEQGEIVFVVDASSSRRNLLPRKIPGAQYLPLEIQGGRTRGALVQDLRRGLEGLETGLVLIDGPAVLPSARAESFVEDVDGAVLVVRAGVTKIQELTRTAQRLTSCGIVILGVVIVGVYPAFQEGSFDLEGMEDGDEDLFSEDWQSDRKRDAEGADHDSAV